MKQTRLFILAVLATVAALSCNKEIAEPQVVPSGEKVYASFTATGEELTKVLLDFADEKSTIKWQDEDKIAVFDGVSKNVFSMKADSNHGNSAVFEGEITDGSGTLYAVYPADAGFDLDGDKLNVTVPSEQTIPSGAFADPKALVSVASGTKGSALAFKQVCGLLKISFAAKNVREITISGQALAGEAKVAADGTLAQPLKPSGDIILTHADGIFPAGTYYVAVLPGTTPAGSFSISVKKGPSVGFKGASNPVTFERCKGIDPGSLDALPTKTEIKTMAELFDWNAGRVGSTEEVVLIGADIDMENEPWVPKDFTGTFDGQGHKLYNLNVSRNANACFINTLTGTLKDVTFGSSDGSLYDGMSRIEQNNPEDTAESGWRYAGLVTRLAAGSSLEYVTSFVPVSIAATSTSKTRVGGLVGIVAGAAGLSECANLGDVVNNAEAPIAAGSLGGIVGWADAAVTMSYVQNKGNVISKNLKTQYIAGILTYDKTAGSTLTDCSNSGNISAEAEGSCAMAIAGIIAESGNSILTRCINEGAISSTCDGECKAGGIIGRSNTGCTLTDCINGGTATITFNPATFASSAYIGGIIGNSPAANEGTISLNGCKNFANLTATHRNINSIGGIVGLLNGKGKLEITNCTNEGNIERIVDDAAAAKNNNICLGGIAAYLAGGAGYSIVGSSNTGKVSTNTNQGSAVVRIAGIAGYLVAATTIKDCANSGAIEYKMGDETTCAGSYLVLGGIVGHMYKNSKIESCTNSGNVFSDRKQVNRVGGIVGTANSSSVISCTNTGAVSVKTPDDVVIKYWQAVAGIVGFTEGTSAGCTWEIRDCVNRGNVSARINAQPNYVGRFGVAGIIGEPFNNIPVSNNANYGSVTAYNTNADAPYSYAGGIMGLDDDSGNPLGGTLTGNKNYGTVANATGKPNNASGGLYGKIGRATSAEGANYGSLGGENAGAVAGVNSITLTATVCDAVNVNGTTKSAAADEAKWLCPANTGTINVTYAAHSDGE
jgi:hypothetical protein